MYCKNTTQTNNSKRGRERKKQRERECVTNRIFFSDLIFQSFQARGRPTSFSSHRWGFCSFLLHFIRLQFPLLLYLFFNFLLNISQLMLAEVIWNLWCIDFSLSTCSSSKMKMVGEWISAVDILTGNINFCRELFSLLNLYIMSCHTHSFIIRCVWVFSTVVNCYCWAWMEKEVKQVEIGKIGVDLVKIWYCIKKAKYLLPQGRDLSEQEEEECVRAATKQMLLWPFLVFLI